MSFIFKPAKREGVHLILGLMGGTGSGKTWSALELATGLAGGKPFAFIDTEAGRALQYADYFEFQHGDMPPPFGPLAYLEAIVKAEKAGFPVIVVDSMSHEQAGDGGILELFEAELDRLSTKDGKIDWKKRERVKFLAWVKPKRDHKKMLYRLLQMRSHLILCFRAEPKIKMVKTRKDGREATEPVDAGWQPVCAKGLEFEMAASFMLRNENPGEVRDHQSEEDPSGQAIKIPKPFLDMRSGRDPLFSSKYLLSRQHGEKLAAWAAGSGTGRASTESTADESHEGPSNQTKVELWMADHGMEKRNGAITRALGEAGLIEKGQRWDDVDQNKRWSDVETVLKTTLAKLPEIER